MACPDWATWDLGDAPRCLGLSHWTILSLGWAIDPGTAVQHLSTLVQLFVTRCSSQTSSCDIRRFSARPVGIQPVDDDNRLIGILSYLGKAWPPRVGCAPGSGSCAVRSGPAPAVFFGLYEFLHGDKRIAGAAVFALATAASLCPELEAPGRGRDRCRDPGPTTAHSARQGTYSRQILGLLVLAYQIRALPTCSRRVLEALSLPEGPPDGHLVGGWNDYGSSLSSVWATQTFGRLHRRRGSGV